MPHHHPDTCGCRLCRNNARLAEADRLVAPLFWAQLLAEDAADADETLVIGDLPALLVVTLERHHVLLETPADVRRSTHRLALEPTPGGLVLRHLVEPE